jgi:hypothetical protein
MIYFYKEIGWTTDYMKISNINQHKLLTICKLYASKEFIKDDEFDWEVMLEKASNAK